MIDLKKYNNVLPFPTTRTKKYPQPQRKKFDNYTDHGIAMDLWEKEITQYDKKYDVMVSDFNKENKRLNELFMYDIMVEFDWLWLSDEKQLSISSHLWEAGDGSKKEVLNYAYEISPLIEDLTKE